MSSELTPKTGQFDEIISIIDNARTRALKAVNAELIQMYLNVGEYLSALCADSEFGDKVIDEAAAYCQRKSRCQGFQPPRTLPHEAILRDLQGR